MCLHGSASIWQLMFSTASDTDRYCFNWGTHQSLDDYWVIRKLLRPACHTIILNILIYLKNETTTHWQYFKTHDKHFRRYIYGTERPLSYKSLLSMQVMFILLYLAPMPPYSVRSRNLDLIWFRCFKSGVATSFLTYLNVENMCLLLLSSRGKTDWRTSKLSFDFSKV